MRVAVNLERRHWRKQQLCLWRKTEVKTAGLAYMNNWLPNDQRSIENKIGAREKVKYIWSAICGLSNEQKIVFLLHCVERNDVSEIAEITDLHERTVRTLLAEALSGIREAIREEVGLLAQDFVALISVLALRNKVEGDRANVATFPCALGMTMATSRARC